ncbi:hypothetical protein PR048_018032 [Dryococelus australis]|uniref:Integrase catalytic domain-containing protein n=1 Tax=Dryococelus australis TaxID=614101 RepID=A0ABQ9HB62_9NEOP|nr:hypothetical protein PR048_018032 [Dryococelus australis]
MDYPTKILILQARDTIRHVLRTCVTCCHQQAATATQIMADLSAARVRQLRPFLHCGVNYAGPFQLRNCKGRSRDTFKGYVALFVCFSTKAVHMEQVSELSTAAFMAALNRFVSRHGRPREISSDCGTNFVGAARETERIVFFSPVREPATKSW